ncbi:lipopolysaccharide biosynthesis protein, partial [Clostridium perfringens]
NMKINFVFYIINIIISFISRSIFIRILGANINGLNSLYISLIGFLNVAELGVGTAVGYSLYKPLSKRNFEKVKDIMILFKYYYRNIAKIILVLGIFLSFFLPILIKNQVDIKTSYIYYFIYLINCVISYLFTYKQTLIIADQKQYKISYILNLTKIIKIIIQCILIYLTNMFIIWLLVEVIFNILGMFLANRKIDFEYKKNLDYSSKKSINLIKKENFQIGQNIRNIFFHKIAGFVIFQTDSIIISIFSTLKEIGIYSNYMMVINSLTALLSNVFGSIMPGIGNLIAEESKEKIYDTFRILYLFDHLLAIFISIVTYNMINEFIILWIGKEYLFPKEIVLALIINLYIQISRGSVDRFKDGFGIYWDIYAPLIESILNLIISIILAYKFGIIGIFIGTIISNILIVEIWKPYILFKEGFKKNILKYINQTLSIYMRNIIIILLSNAIYYKLSKLIYINNLLIRIIFDGILISFTCGILILLVYGKVIEFKNIFKMINNKIILTLRNKLLNNI